MAATLLTDNDHCSGNDRNAGSYYQLTKAVFAAQFLHQPGTRKSQVLEAILKHSVSGLLRSLSHSQFKFIAVAHEFGCIHAFDL